MVVMSMSTNKSEQIIFTQAHTKKHHTFNHTRTLVTESNSNTHTHTQYFKPNQIFVQQQKDRSANNLSEEHLTLGQIQGDGRKFLHRFKSYFGSQLSSQSLNEVHIYRLQPKSATKGVFFSYISVFDCFESASRIANGERSRRSAAR